MAGYRGKRLLDICVTILFAPAWVPLLVCTALAVRLVLGSPVFFVQIRPGLHTKPFRMVKFRTMRELRDSGGDLLPDTDRLTRFGAILRSTSLDELPELINVLRGEMSLVGPRPLLTGYLHLYTPKQARRHAVRPGITGWAQVNGRNLSTWVERLDHDVWYVEHASFALDMAILLRTIRKVLRRDGISHAGSATMPPFTGTPDAR